jgi:hypothetical protein
MSIIQDMEDLAQEEIDRILRHHNRCRCYWQFLKHFESLGRNVEYVPVLLGL